MFENNSYTFKKQETLFTHMHMLAIHVSAKIYMQPT